MRVNAQSTSNLGVYYNLKWYIEDICDIIILSVYGCKNCGGKSDRRYKSIHVYEICPKKFFIYMLYWCAKRFVHSV